LEATFLTAHLDRLQHVLGEAVAPKTCEGWGAGLLQFNQYCNLISLLEEGQMPTSELLLALFVANCAAGNIASSTIDKLLAGIHHQHQISNAPWFNSQFMSQAKKGGARLAPAVSK